MNCIGILFRFIQTHSKDQERDERDLAAHTLAIIIEAYDIKNCREDAHSFLTMLMEHKDDPKFLAPEAYSHCLMYLMKCNELALKFIERRGFHILQKLLASECIHNPTIAYNVCCTLWVLSYLPQATVYFGDFRLNIFEHVSKILDFFNKEKIVRIICMLFDNLKENEECLEHLSMINALNLVIKLQNRPWVDEHIKEVLERLF